MSDEEKPQVKTPNEEPQDQQNNIWMMLGPER